jgi:hypothetical protein
MKTVIEHYLHELHLRLTRACKIRPWFVVEFYSGKATNGTKHYLTRGGAAKAAQKKMAQHKCSENCSHYRAEARRNVAWHRR